MSTYGEPGQGGNQAITQTPHGATPLTFVYIGVGVLGILLNGGFEFFRFQAAQAAKSAATQTAVVQQEIATRKPFADQVTKYELYAVDLHSVFGQQVKWEGVLAQLEARMYRRSALSSIQITDKGEITLVGAAPNYVDYAKTYSSLTSEEGAAKLFNRLKVQTIGRPQGKAAENIASNLDIAFTLRGTLTQDVLHPKTVVAPTP
jgi:hypothetical protein